MSEWKPITRAIQKDTWTCRTESIGGKSVCYFTVHSYTWRPFVYLGVVELERLVSYMVIGFDSCDDDGNVWSERPSLGKHTRHANWDARVNRRNLVKSHLLHPSVLRKKHGHDWESAKGTARTESRKWGEVQNVKRGHWRGIKVHGKKQSANV